MWESKRARLARMILKKSNKMKETNLTNFKTYYISYYNQDCGIG